MMKIKIDGKELKLIIEKAMCNIYKGKEIGVLNKVVLANTGNTLQAYTSDMVGYLQINTSSYDSLEKGTLGIDNNDLKILLKMNNEVIIEELENSILVKNGSKSISLQKYDVSKFPHTQEEEYTELLRFKEWEFQEIISNLFIFSFANENNKIMQAIHFNIDDSRIEALDGHRIEMRTIEETEKVTNSGKILIHNTIVQHLKKTLDKKSYDIVSILESKNYIKVCGKSFIYTQKKLDGEFFKVSNMLEGINGFSFKADAKKMLEHIKYYTDNVIEKSSRGPILFKISNSITSYAENLRVQASDVLQVKDFIGKEIHIAFNPYFLVDALKIADSEEISVVGGKSKTPIIIKANKYSFLVLPVTVKELENKMETYLSKIKE